MNKNTTATAKISSNLRPATAPAQSDNYGVETAIEMSSAPIIKKLKGIILFRNNKIRLQTSMRKVTEIFKNDYRAFCQKDKKLVFKYNFIFLAKIALPILKTAQLKSWNKKKIIKKIDNLLKSKQNLLAIIKPPTLSLINELNQEQKQQFSDLIAEVLTFTTTKDKTTINKDATSMKLISSLLGFDEIEANIWLIVYNELINHEYQQNQLAIMATNPLLLTKLKDKTISNIAEKISLSVEAKLVFDNAIKQSVQNMKKVVNEIMKNSNFKITLANSTSKDNEEMSSEDDEMSSDDESSYEYSSDEYSSDEYSSDDQWQLFTREELDNVPTPPAIKTENEPKSKPKSWLRTKIDNVLHKKANNKSTIEKAESEKKDTTASSPSIPKTISPGITKPASASKANVVTTNSNPQNEEPIMMPASLSEKELYEEVLEELKNNYKKRFQPKNNEVTTNSNPQNEEPIMIPANDSEDADDMITSSWNNDIATSVNNCNSYNNPSSSQQSNMFGNYH